jgi:integrase
VVLNWAVNEEFLKKNYLKGLRVVDPIHLREKRLPFDEGQLSAIFAAPLYSGCQNDCEGYARKGDMRPTGTRYWVPLVGLLSGMRLNEICQMDTSDVREIDGIECFVVTTRSMIGTTDKRLKTRNSERLVPVHPRLIELGFLKFVSDMKSSGKDKMFYDINPGKDGIRSTSFSKWFISFLIKSKANKPRTSFHSFRHSFRDALREAGVDREVAMALGGWGSGGKSGLDVSDYYGRGYHPGFLRDEIAKIDFPLVDTLTSL